MTDLPSTPTRGWRATLLDVHREDDLPWRTRAELTPDDARRLAARAFPRDRIVSATAFPSGVRNTCLRVDRADGARPVVLRVYDAEPAACARERDLLLRLREHDAPVPDVIEACPDGRDGIGPFLVLELVEGVTFRDLKNGDDREAAAQAAHSLGFVLAGIGRIRFPTPGRLGPGLHIGAPFVPGPDPFVVHIERCLDRPAARRRLDPSTHERLAKHVRARAKPLRTAAASSTLVHGDLGAANVLVRREHDTWRVAAVIDWEVAFSGSPLVDLGHFLRYERAARPLREPAFSRGYREGGGELPDGWRDLARTVDLADLCGILARETTPDSALEDVVALVKRTLDASR